MQGPYPAPKSTSLIRILFAAVSSEFEPVSTAPDGSICGMKARPMPEVPIEWGASGRPRWPGVHPEDCTRGDCRGLGCGKPGHPPRQASGRNYMAHVSALLPGGQLKDDFPNPASWNIKVDGKVAIDLHAPACPQRCVAHSHRGASCAFARAGKEAGQQLKSRCEISHNRG